MLRGLIVVLDFDIVDLQLENGLPRGGSNLYLYSGVLVLP